MATDDLTTQIGRLTEAEIAAMNERLQNVHSRIAEAARTAGRSLEEITLIGVSKFFPAEAARAAVELGLRDLGENRVQEMLPKIEQLAAAGLQPNWHLIGTLQKNKVRQVVGRTCLIHSADSLELLEEISRRGLTAGVVSDVLMQVNTAGEATKHGFSAAETAQVAEAAAGLPGIRLRGLMTMAPLFENADDTLPVFESTQMLFRRVREMLHSAEFNILSMGMSHDFPQAIYCGATHIRIGTSIFGPRV